MSDNFTLHKCPDFCKCSICNDTNLNEVNNKPYPKVILDIILQNDNNDAKAVTMFICKKCARDLCNTINWGYGSNQVTEWNV